MLDIKGFQKTSLIDYPGNVSSIIFLSRCNMGCPYCHNPDLVINYKGLPNINENDILDYLRDKKDWIDGIVISGGEPTLHDELREFIRKVKQLGFRVKIDTNGTRPEILRELIKDKKLWPSIK